MNVVCVQTHLKEALRVVERSVAKHATLPVLQNVLIKTESGSLLFQATNLEVGTSIKIPAKINSQGSIVLPAKILAESIHAFSNESISLVTSRDNSLMRVESGATRIAIKGLNAEDFPSLPSQESESSAEVPRQKFIEHLGALLPLASFSDSRPEISGVFFHFTDSSLVLAATDTFRLGERRISLPQSTIHDAQCITPLFAAQEIMRIFSSGDEENLSFFLDRTHLEVRTPRVRFISRLVEGNYPNYAHIIPTAIKTEAKVDRAAFAHMVKSASTMTGRLSDIHLVFKPEEKKIEAKAEDSAKGTFETSIVAQEMKGETGAIVFNWRYLIDGLEGFRNEQIVCMLCGDGKPAIIRPHEDDKEALYLLMPIKAT